MSKLIVGNWKLNPETWDEAEALFEAYAAMPVSEKVDLVACPPFLFLSARAAALAAHHFALGAQDVFSENKGAFTGEISPTMLRSAGVRYVIIGHSERRALGETDQMVNAKIRAAQAAGLSVILCVGESKEVRTGGLDAAKDFVGRELAAALAEIGQQVIVAYEPIWAIGTGVADDPAETVLMARSIKQNPLVSRVLYGGSVNAQNAPNFISQPEIDGALVGGASLKAEEFAKIIEVAGHH